MDIKKNDIFNLKITALSNDGSGVGRNAEGEAVFVPFTAVGDEIEAHAFKIIKSVIHGEIEKIITPSPDRTTLDCTVFGKCGGCDFRHITYEAEIRAKENFIRDAFTRIGKLSPEFLPIIPSENINHYRNNVQFPVGLNAGGELFYGFCAPKSKEIIPHEDCKLYPTEIKEVADLVIEKIKNSKKLTNRICIRKGHYSGEICAVFDDENTAVIGKNIISDTMGGVKVKISPRSFYQVNTIAAEKLYELVKEFTEPKGKIILDLYCGIGAIGLSMASEAKEIIGVEIIESAVLNARENAKINGFSNARFIHGDASIEINAKPDVIILDPARRGCDVKVLESAARLNPERIIMVSCNPATAARDCARLKKLSYEPVKVGGVDLFPRTRHVECVGLLIKKS